MKPLFELEGKRVWVAGHRGMVGSALVRLLSRENCEVLTVPRSEVDLRDQAATRRWLVDTKPDAVIMAAARVGGIAANSASPVSFLYDNLMIEANVIEGSARAGVEKLLLLGSTCIYPRDAEQPIREESLLTGPLEKTNEWYAIAKIAGIKLCQAYRQEQGLDFISAQPTNLYGPGDNYDLETSHVLPALIRKAHEAKLNNADSLTIWGSGKPLREFLHVDDLAEAVVFLLRNYSDTLPVNIGSGEELSIADVAHLVCETVGFEGPLSFDRSRPDGTPRKLADLTRLHGLGWDNARPLRVGLKQTYENFLASQ
ncbi:GDP-L-fucose synthase family protein [Aliirhizobium cellulosilyticum]|uniref:GDP-L-fucose synthase n=1 Tax=Aliirhizobium cellulosilyticum TaxID=393664 RepID=A0A7W6WQR7_9HYPH|nr:GDP-L-fucose synthase [Rhizobium cellulosilyticum]MBB4412051.1 GDP-L-fucose synthase [Rhizobium cellulosilyticum]MBB4446683.1 GDP-L-fucose synthase [Rhizobium cellulosilyticum]